MNEDAIELSRLPLLEDADLEDVDEFAVRDASTKSDENPGGLMKRVRASALGQGGDPGPSGGQTVVFLNDADITIAPNGGTTVVFLLATLTDNRSINLPPASGPPMTIVVKDLNSGAGPGDDQFEIFFTPDGDDNPPEAGATEINQSQEVIAIANDGDASWYDVMTSNADIFGIQNAIAFLGVTLKVALNELNNSAGMTPMGQSMMAELNVGEQGKGSVTSLPKLWNAGEIYVPEVGLLDLPDMNDGFDLGASLLVTSPDGTNWIVVSLQTVIAANSPGDHDLDWTAATIDSQGGDDLTWDSGVLSSTAGGMYQAQLVALAEPD